MEEEFLLHLNLSKCTKKDNVEKSVNESGSRRITRYRQVVSSQKHICKKSRLDLAPYSKKSRNIRHKKVTLSQKIANLKKATKQERKTSHQKSCSEQPATDLGETSNEIQTNCEKSEGSNHDNEDNDGDDKSNEFSCKLCNFMCFSKTEFEKHALSTSHVIKSEIEQGTQREILEEEKKRWNNLKMPATCDVCFAEFTEREKFIRHKRSHEKLNPFKCIHCFSVFQHRNDLASHLKRHLGVRNIACKNCGKSFDKTRNLESHMMSKHGKEDTRPRNFKCTECGEAFLSKSAVNRHMRWHTGFRPESCHFCGQSFHTKYDLQQHKRVHSGEKPFKCSVCPYVARTAQLLKRHQQIHTGEKPYSCKHCSFTCKNTTGLKRHMNQHTGKKPFKCPYCSLRCGNIENLRKHIKKVKKHRGLKIYPCSHCMSYSTDDGNEYLLHMKQYHFPYLDMKTATATKLSGIQVDENLPDDQESEMEDAASNVSHSNIFDGTTRELLHDDNLSQDALNLEPMLTNSNNILPDLTIRTIESLNENGLHCLTSQGAANSRIEKGDILLSSMASFDGQDPCKQNTFTSSALFGDETCNINSFPAASSDVRTSGNETITTSSSANVNNCKHDEPDVGHGPTGVECNNINNGFLSVMVLEKVILSTGEEGSPLTLVVNSNAVPQDMKPIKNKIMLTELQSPNSSENLVSCITNPVNISTMEHPDRTLFTEHGSSERPDNQVISSPLQSPVKTFAVLSSPETNEVQQRDETPPRLEKSQRIVPSVSTGRFMTASSIHVSSVPPKVLTVSPEKNDSLQKKESENNMTGS